MSNLAPRGDAVTVLMTVDSTDRIALFSGGTKIAEQQVGNKTLSTTLTVASLRFGATEPNGYDPGTFLMEQVSGWTFPLVDSHALPVSADLNYVQVSPPTVKPVVSIPAILTVKEGETLQIPVTKEGAGACTVQLRTIGVSAVTPTDYTGFLLPVAFGVNDTVVTVPLVTIADTEDDPDQTLKIELSLAGSTDCTLGNSNGIITITEPPRISVPTTASVKEGNVLSVIVTKLGSGACSVTWRTSSDTATVLSSDYTGVSATTLNFTSVETSKTITVQTLTDAFVEGNEFFYIFIENPVNCKVTTGSCKVMLIDANSPEVPVQTAYTPASGFASAADCGLGYPVYKVTNLDDSGTGSLRDCVSGSGRMVVFEVAGRITLLTDIRPSANITIAGETAPPPGITIQKKELVITNSNVRVSHITFERGYENSDLYRDNGDVAKIGTGGSVSATTLPDYTPKTAYTNIHIYHCAFYWGMDETVQMFPWNSHTLSASYHDCIITEPLYKPSIYDSTLLNHVKTYKPYNQSDHNYGMICAFNTKQTDIQYCLFSEISMRCPFIDHSTEVVIANNIANNCRNGVTIQQNQYMVLNTTTNTLESKPLPASYTYKVTCKGYLAISGPDTITSVYGGFRFTSYLLPQPANSKVFVEKLYGWKGGASNSTYMQPNDYVTYGSTAAGYNDVKGKPYWLNAAGTKVAVEVTTPPIDTPTPTVGLEAQEIFDRAVLNVGPRPKEIRNLIDKKTGAIGNHNVARSVTNLKNKTGRWVNHQDETQVGGYYAPAKVTRTLNSTAKFPDGTLIGDIPAQPQPATATSKATMKAWLRKHLDQVQND